MNFGPPCQIKTVELFKTNQNDKNFIIMETRYGVAINNRYAMFDDDDCGDDPIVIAKATVDEKVNKKGPAEAKEGKNKKAVGQNDNNNKTVQERNDKNREGNHN